MRSMMCAISCSVAFSDMLTIIGFLPSKLFHHGGTESQRKPLCCACSSVCFLCVSVVKVFLLQNAKAAISAIAASGRTLLESRRSWLTRSPGKFRRRLYSGKPVVAERPGKRGKSHHQKQFLRQSCTPQTLSADATIVPRWPHWRRHCSRSIRSGGSCPPPEPGSQPA